MTEPVVAAVSMGYGHLRPAAALADALGTTVVHADRPPLAVDGEARLWERTRRLYEATTRWSSFPYVGVPLRAVVAGFTDIPHLHPYRDQSAPTFGVRSLQRAIRRGMGGSMARLLRETGRPLLTTYFATAIAADAAGCEGVFCVVTDSDINRIWAPPDPATSRIRYLAPSMRALRRLRAYGVPRASIHVTGYPLPGELLGGETLETLKRNLAGRIVRLDPERSFRESYPDELRHFLGPLPADQEGRPPLLTFAVGGAGAQTDIVARALPTLETDIAEERLRLALVAGIRPDVEERFGALLERTRVGDRVEILRADSHEAYFREFNALLARTDILWTKPSELTFFGALGMALVLSPPVGVHEWYNRRWARESGAALKQRDPRHAHQWLREWLDDGLLASAAWSGFTRLPKFGLYRIRALVLGEG